MQWKHICSHPIHSVTLDSVPETTKIHNGCSPHIKDSAKHFSYHRYPSCTCVNKACSGNTFTPFCSHPMHSVTLVGTQLNIFLTPPNLPVHGSTRHPVEIHLLHSAVTQCIMWHLTVSQKLHQLNSGVPHTCLTSGDSAKHFLTTPILPIHVSTRHAVDVHSLHLQSSYAFCDT